jgi:hypothetical protein
MGCQAIHGSHSFEEKQKWREAKVPLANIPVAYPTFVRSSGRSSSSGAMPVGLV